MPCGAEVAEEEKDLKIVITCSGLYIYTTSFPYLWSQNYSLIMDRIYVHIGTCPTWRHLFRVGYMAIIPHQRGVLCKGHRSYARWIDSGSYGLAWN